MKKKLNFLCVVLFVLIAAEGVMQSWSMVHLTVTTTEQVENAELAEQKTDSTEAKADTEPAVTFGVHTDAVLPLTLLSFDMEKHRLTFENQNVDLPEVKAIPTKVMASVPYNGFSNNPAVVVLASLLLTVVFIIIVVKFVKLIIRINKNEVFSWRNVKSLRTIGWLLLAYTITNLLQEIEFTVVAMQKIHLKDCIVLYTDNINLWYVVEAVIVLIIAEIFALGLRLQEDKRLLEEESALTI